MKNTSDEIVKGRDAKDVVRLRVNGIASAVNTLRDQITSRGVSLLCPFPALEVSVPVSFGTRDESMQGGTIHRIGVEDDPETGLPRLRLSVRTGEARDKSSREVSEATMKESDSTSEETEDQKATGDMEASDFVIVESEVEHVKPKSKSGTATVCREAERAAGEPYRGGLSSRFSDTDPDWSDWGEMPLPEDIMKRARARRRQRIAVHATWVGLVVILLATGFILDRAGIVRVKEVKEYVASLPHGQRTGGKISSAAPPVVPLSNESTTSKESVLLASKTEPLPAEEPASSKDGTPGASTPETGGAAASPAQGVELAANDEGAPAVADSPEGAVATSPKEAGETEGKVAEDSVEEGASNEEEFNPDEVVLSLPTRWPVEYTTGYRVRDPNGVVIDVPGGLVKREGWLETGWHHPMVRSVKAVQRESGARFIIFVNGELPRFMTSPQAGGVSLRLYHNEDNVKKTDQVASLN